MLDYLALPFEALIENYLVWTIRGSYIIFACPYIFLQICSQKIFDQKLFYFSLIIIPPPISQKFLQCIPIFLGFVASNNCFIRAFLKTTIFQRVKEWRINRQAFVMQKKRKIKMSTTNWQIKWRKKWKEAGLHIKISYHHSHFYYLFRGNCCCFV